jgi:hypothetical protein
MIAVVWASFGLAFLLTAGPGSAEEGKTVAKEQSKDMRSAKFETYRAAIQKEYGIDIRDFKGQIKGGRADGKDITQYELKQLMMGIKVEQEHTTDRLLALEIATDHLEEFPDYYTRLEKMEQEAEKEAEAKKKKKN